LSMNERPARTAISPSDLTFGSSGCKRCFWLKYRLGVQLSTPFPGIVTALAARQERWYKDKTASDFSPDLPVGKVHSTNKKLTSAPLVVDGVATPFTITGKYDFLLKYEDGTFGIVDTKVSAKSGKANFYWPQLAAYRYLLAHPASGEPRVCSTLGLVVWTPTQAERTGDAAFAVGFAAAYEAVSEPDGAFDLLIGDVVRLIDSPLPPEPEECATCAFVRTHPLAH